MGTHIVVLPGNPGMWCFYRKFVERLILRFGDDVRIYFINYRGHGIDTDRLTKKFNYDELIHSSYIDHSTVLFKQYTKKRPTHHINIFCEVESQDNVTSQITHQTQFSLGIMAHILNGVDRSKNDRVVLIGHSVGSYVALRCTEKYYNHIDSVYLTCPVFEHSRITSKYWTMRLIFMFRLVLIMLSWMLAIILRCLSIIPVKLILDSDTIDLYYLLRPANVEVCIDMSKSEFDDLDREYPRGIFEKDRKNKKIKIILAKDDPWSPKNYCKILIHDGVVNKEMIHTLRVEHAYNTSELSYCKVVDKIHQLETYTLDRPYALSA
ncbi:hypothetical protein YASMINEVIRUS_314 [Yasminevirus sp. GU-2018]|uniref:Uncharacterized protein n=1 Tax=Yasminevirus sp. GU-2018 TaxID=2420051 RepID=A0A5K0U8J9_9VIRU|nr:hypothetical protein YASMINEVIRUS_314 [Yasminevirus sp. GU-2018]